MPAVHTRLTQEYEATPHSKANQKKEYQNAYQNRYWKSYEQPRNIRTTRKLTTPSIVNEDE